MRRDAATELAALLRPTDARCGRLRNEELTGSRRVVYVLHAGPRGREHEQRPPVRPAEHTGEAATIELDHLQHLASFAYPHATLVRHVGVPDRLLGVHADPVGRTITRIGPDPAIRQATVRGNVEGAQASGPGLGDDQRRAVFGDGHTVAERDVVGHLLRRAVRMHQRD